MPFRALLFDFDGTLADSYAAITASVNHVRQVHGLAPLPEEKIRHLVGHGLQQLMADVIPGGDPEADAKLYRTHHPSIMLTHTHLLPGVAEALAQLHQRGIKMAVCSNKPSSFTRPLLDYLKIAPYFDATLGPEDAGNPKPDPTMIRVALERLGVPTEEALYIGDMEVDIETARRAGVPVWVLPTGSNDVATLQQSHPDRIMRDMNDLLPALYPGA